MKIFVNNEEMEFEENLTTIDNIKNLLIALKEKNLVILETWANDVRTEENLLELVKLNKLEKVSLIVATPQQLVIEGMHTSTTYLPVLIQGIRDVACLFQEGREGEAIAKFIEAHSGLEWLGHILSGAILYLAIDNQDLTDSFKNTEESYRQKIAELTQAWENRDYVLIADLLEYELVPFLEEDILPLFRNAADLKE